MSPTAEDTVEVQEWTLEDIERELETISNEATHLPPGPTADRIQACAAAAMGTIAKLLGRE